VKFLGVDIGALLPRLEAAGATCCGACFERNEVFDTPERGLRGQDVLLRLRSAGKSVLTLKRRPEVPTPAGVKVFDEFETEVADPEAMRSILIGLGYLEAFRYEKIRATWRLAHATVCLDRLPFGDFVEIEGAPEAIADCAARLGLDISGASTKTYHQLNREHRAASGLPAEESFIFPEDASVPTLLW